MVALAGHRIAGFNLISFGNVYIPLMGMTRRFRPCTAWSSHIAVHKDFRKRGLASQIRYAVLRELEEVGCKRLYGGTLSHNIPALKLTRRIGFQEFVDVHYTRALWRRMWRYVRVV